MSDDFAVLVKKELVEDPEVLLRKNIGRVKRFIALTPDGEISIVRKGLPGKLQIALYYVGASYAHNPTMRTTESVANTEISTALNLPSGSVRPWVAELRKARIIYPTEKGFYAINRDRVAEVLDWAEEVANKEAKPSDS